MVLPVRSLGIHSWYRDIFTALQYLSRVPHVPAGYTDSFTVSTDSNSVGWVTIHICTTIQVIYHFSCVLVCAYHTQTCSDGVTLSPNRGGSKSVAGMQCQSTSKKVFKGSAQPGCIEAHLDQREQLRHQIHLTAEKLTQVTCVKSTTTPSQLVTVSGIYCVTQAQY